jgi:hypothetical protein
MKSIPAELFSSKFNPGEILADYRGARFPDWLYILRIRILWADWGRRLDVQSGMPQLPWTHT